MDVQAKIQEIVKKHWPDEISKQEKEKAEQRERISILKRRQFGTEVGALLTELGVEHTYSKGFWNVGLSD